MNTKTHVPEPLLLPMCISLRNPWDYPNKRFPGSKRNPGNARGTDQNQRVSSPLSPICSLLLEPSGKLSHKLQDLLAEEEQAQRSTPPLIQQRRPGPRNSADGLPSSEWKIVAY